MSTLKKIVLSAAASATVAVTTYAVKKLRARFEARDIVNESAAARAERLHVGRLSRKARKQYRANHRAAAATA